MEELRPWQIELDRIAWGNLRDIRVDLPNEVVSASYVPQAVEGLLAANSDDEATRFYWQLENHVVVQGRTYQAAEPLVGVLLTALAEPMPDFVLSWVLELLFQMTAYYPAATEVDLGNEHLTFRCRQQVISRRTFLEQLRSQLQDPSGVDLLLNLESTHPLESTTRTPLDQH